MTAISRDSQKLKTAALVTLAGLAVIAALKFAGDLVAPIVFAFVVGIVLAPAVRKGHRIGLPHAIAAAIGLIVALASFVLIGLLFAPVVSGFMDQLPIIKYDIQRWLDQASQMIRGVDPTGQMQQTIEENSDEAVKAAASSVLGALWMAPNFAAQVLVFAGTLYFFLLTGDEIYRRIPGHPDCLRQADRAVSQYFLTVSAINICLGIAVFGVMTLVGMEHPALWGAAACVLNFALYLGPLAMLASLFVAGLMQFHGGYAVVPMLAYLALNMTEAQFVTPSLVGQQMSLNPLIVFLAILFGLWLWGPVGGIVALPVLVWIQAFLDDPRDICAEPEAAMAR